MLSCAVLVEASGTMWLFVLLLNRLGRVQVYAASCVSYVELIDPLQGVIYLRMHPPTCSGHRMHTHHHMFLAGGHLMS